MITNSLWIHLCRHLQNTLYPTRDKLATCPDHQDSRDKHGATYLTSTPLTRTGEGMKGLIASRRVAL